jgi:hypothetical protein
VDGHRCLLDNLHLIKVVQIVDMRHARNVV